MRRNVLAPTFWVAPDSREPARRGARLLADAVRDQVGAQPRLQGSSAEELLQMAMAIHTAALISDTEFAELRAQLMRGATPPAR